MDNETAEQIGKIRDFMSKSTSLTTDGFEHIDRGFKIIEMKFKLLNERLEDIEKAVKCSS